MKWRKIHLDQQIVGVKNCILRGCGNQGNHKKDCPQRVTIGLNPLKESEEVKKSWEELEDIIEPPNYQKEQEVAPKET
jgi:ABC-type phosphate/phosphonate transport system substrate-binding protein